MSRKVIIYNSVTANKEYIDITDDITSWGQLKRKINTDIGNKTCVLSGSKHVLAMDEATIPATDFTVFVYPKESKGGMTAKKKPVKKAKPAAKKKAVKKSAPKKKAAPVLTHKEEEKVMSDAELREEAARISSGIRGFR